MSKMTVHPSVSRVPGDKTGCDAGTVTIHIYVYIYMCVRGCENRAGDIYKFGAADAAHSVSNRSSSRCRRRVCTSGFTQSVVRSSFASQSDLFSSNVPERVNPRAMSEAHFDEYEHFNYDYDKHIFTAHGGKQRSKREAVAHTNHFDPSGHSRKILTKLMNTEHNKRQADKAKA